MAVKGTTKRDAGCETKNGTGMKVCSNVDDLQYQWVRYLEHCAVGNKCYLLREEQMAILIVLKYGRRLDP